MPRNEISNSDDVIDSRDVIARIEELETEINDAKDGARDVWRNDWTDEQRAATDIEAMASQYVDDNLSDEAAELKALQGLQDDAGGYAPDWQHGATLIRDSYFVEYAEELCKDICELPRNIPHYIVIDWKATAENIQVDYTSVEFDGITYWVR